MKKKAGKRAAGEGLLRERSDGRWEARIPTKVDPLTGKQKFKTLYGHSQAEAKAKRDEYLTAVRTDTYVEPKKTQLGDYMKKWLEIYVLPKIKESTYSKYLFIDHLLHSVAFRIPNRLILLDKNPDTVAIWDYKKPN